VSSTSVN